MPVPFFVSRSNPRVIACPPSFPSSTQTQGSLPVPLLLVPLLRPTSSVACPPSSSQNQGSLPVPLLRLLCPPSSLCLSPSFLCPPSSLLPVPLLLRCLSPFFCPLPFFFLPSKPRVIACPPSSLLLLPVPLLLRCLSPFFSFFCKRTRPCVGVPLWQRSRR